MAAKFDLVVVGAGPAGAALAAVAARAGARVALLERARHPRPKACAEYASPRIVEELAHIGLDAAAWRPHAVPLDAMRLFVGDSSAEITYADRFGGRTAWGLTRSSFDAVLAHHAAASGAELLEQTSFVGLVGDFSDHIEGVEISRGGRRSSLTADWVIGADGARSTVARALDVERPVRLPRRLGLVAHHSGVAGLERHGEMHVGRGGYVGLAPTPGGELNVGMALSMEGNGAASAAMRFDAALEGLPRAAGRLQGTRRLTPIRGAAPIGHRVSRVAGPGWLLVGDAAGFVDPFTGEGIYRALRSARLAAESLASGWNADDTLATVAARYRRRRRAAFAAKDALTWLVQGFLAWPPLLGHAVQRLDERPAAALRLGSALGDCRPATDALSPAALLSVLA